MEYTVTVQRKGSLVCSNCTDTTSSLIQNSPIAIGVIDQKGEISWAVKGFIDRDGELVCQDEYKPRGGM